MSQSTQLSTFNFETHAIRTIAINNEPWFIAKDVCEAVNISNYRDAIERLDEDEKGVALLDEKIENAQSQVSFNGRSVSYQVAELTKQRDRYQQMLDEQLAQSGQCAKKHRIKYARFI